MVAPALYSAGDHHSRRILIESPGPLEVPANGHHHGARRRVSGSCGVNEQRVQPSEDAEPVRRILLGHECRVDHGPTASDRAMTRNGGPRVSVGGRVTPVFDCLGSVPATCERVKELSKRVTYGYSYHLLTISKEGWPR